MRHLGSFIAAAALLVGRGQSVAAQRLAATPPMGFNTWNKFACNVSEDLVKGMADAMATSGMKDVGYRYVVIDDCWQVSRDGKGAIVADPGRFPNGMKALADYIHGKGLQFGIYTDLGTKTCAGRPGSYGHHSQDAKTYASWGVDYVKVDWCHADSLSAAAQYRSFRRALEASGRPIVLSICEWGTNNPWEWGPSTGQLWRTTADIDDNWGSMITIALANERHPQSAGPGHWNDPDMLEVGNGGMSLDEYRTHFTLWAIMAAPLIAGNDLRAMTPEIKAILTNRDVIAVNQDPLGIQGRIVADNGDGVQTWAKPLRGGAVAAALVNLTADSAGVWARWQDLGIQTRRAKVRDLWGEKDLGFVDDSGNYNHRFRVKVPPHGVVMLRVTPAAAGPKRPN